MEQSAQEHARNMEFAQYIWIFCSRFQIPSYDSNSHCLCVAGEVYCWWQNYNPSTDPSAGPPFLPSTTIESNYTPSLEGSTDAVDSSEASGDPVEEPSVEQQGYVEINVTYSTTSQPAPTTCLVMGNKLVACSFSVDSFRGRHLSAHRFPMRRELPRDN